MSPAQTDLAERLAWLYGDVAARIAHNQPDLQKWRHIGGEPYSGPEHVERQFTQRINIIALGAFL